MDWDAHRTIRDEAIKRMETALRHVDPIDLPTWAIQTLILPFFLITLGQIAMSMLWAMAKVMGMCVAKFLCAPVVAAYLFTDLVCISWWNFKRIAERMSR